MDRNTLIYDSFLLGLCTVKSGLTGSGLTGFSGSTGQDARSLQISYPLQWEDSGLTGFRFNRLFNLNFGLSGFPV